MAYAAGIGYYDMKAAESWLRGNQRRHEPSKSTIKLMLKRLDPIKNTLAQRIEIVTKLASTWPKCWMRVHEEMEKQKMVIKMKPKNQLRAAKERIRRHFESHGARDQRRMARRQRDLRRQQRAEG